MALTCYSFNMQSGERRRRKDGEGEEAFDKKTERGREKKMEKTQRQWNGNAREGRMGRRKWESDREAVEQIKVKLSAFTYLDERF